MLKQKDVIFEISDYANARAREIGAENVYNFSLGNPSVPAPDSVAAIIKGLVDDLAPLALHGYGPGKGITEVRNQIAQGLNARYGCYYSGENIFMTSGASGALAHAFRAVCEPGDEIITFAPCFSEYTPYTAGAGLKLTVIPADVETFQIPFKAFEETISEKTAAVLINTPNNPSGIVYSTETLRRLAAILEEKSSAFGHPIFLISDEPYRDIVFSGVDSPYVADFYANTLTCYSFSKSISLPGERIGYLAVNPDCPYAEEIIELCPQISRTIGHNGTATLIQRTAGLSCRETADLAVYEKNKTLLYEALTEYGYTCVKPGGTFYMFPRSLEPDDAAFCRRAREELNLMLVPGNIFGCPGHFRIAYCVPTGRVEKALPIFKKLKELYD